LIDIDLT